MLSSRKPCSQQGEGPPLLDKQFDIFYSHCASIRISQHSPSIVAPIHHIHHLSLAAF